MQKNVSYLMGVFWFAIHLFICSGNDMLQKYLTSSLNSYQVVFFRFLFSCLTLLPFGIYQGKKAFLTSRPLLHVARGFLLFAAISFWCYGLSIGNISSAVVTNFSIPIIVLILAKFFLNEKIGLVRWVATLIGFFGVIINFNPSAGNFDASSIVILISSICFATLDILNKKFVVEESMFAMLFYSSLFTLGFSLVPTYIYWQTPSLFDIRLLMLLGIGANLLLYFLLKSFSYIDASAASPYRYLELVITASFAYMVFGEIPTYHSLIAACIIIPSTLYLSYAEKISFKNTNKS